MWSSVLLVLLVHSGIRAQALPAHFMQLAQLVLFLLRHMQVVPGCMGQGCLL